MTGASSAVLATDNRIMMPARKKTLPRITDSRVHDVIKNIRKEVHHKIGRGNDENAALDQRVVSRLDGLNREAADPRPRENSLCDDGAGKETPELKSYNCDRGKKRIAQRMFDPNYLLAYPLGPSGLNIFLMDSLQET
jgi:hypothetical protein